ncbi:aspartate/glutamate racemase family protein [Pararhizobium sp. YC-54]|uniref:maleate cis-trans isomerase family protein n=1 Tax=Pararhizobium sp. YC-54 TaxID=2986920 RepID=UPI0021F7C0CE|nr:aspartate/glutamate racemase family protein [Pararhizobium sp. YC-54]MCV9999365.1 aspartate/glutamate racemase family protein [Pararhizobium sp. YC-54]
MKRDGIYDWQIATANRPETDKRVSIGVILLANDQACEGDFKVYLESLRGVQVLTTRISMASKLSRGALEDMAEHLTDACKVLVPEAHLDAVAFACTTGTVVIGPDRLKRILQAARPRSHISTPIHAAGRAFRATGVHRISVLTPYPLHVTDVIPDYFEGDGFKIDRCTTYNLTQEDEINGVSTESLIEAGISAMDPRSDALFISCTGLRTCDAIAPLEQKLGKPVVTSNQALVWDCLRSTGLVDKIAGRGTLFDR